ncbi:MAG: exodeoxyribonuclease V subunit beta [Chitinophagaceae bacterium]
MTDFKPFNASTVELQGTNLIEASAGTGKTYSIALLVLRLVLEKKLSIKEILMVTFTKAAVAELEERIRLFVRKAYKISLGQTIEDLTITKLVQQVEIQFSKQEIQAQLKEAVLFLDETSVLTIHSFCQLTLTEFAFETNQLFGTDTLKDHGAIIQEEVNRFWRENITTIPADLLKFLVEAGLTRDTIKEVVKEHLKGKKYFNYEKDKVYSFCEEDHQKIIAELKEVKGKEEKLREEMENYIKNNEKDIRLKSEGNAYARKAKLHLYETSSELVKSIREKKSSQYIHKIFAEIITHCDDCDKAADDLKEKTHQVISDINCQAINIITTGLEDFKQRNNLLSFDDMIINLHKAFTGRENTKLVESLQQKYKAVFIDEFQDTDRLQYEIFQKAFGSNTILFYIGDPKQSIYAFRKADIFTYFKAKEEVQHRYTMNQNFRSSENLILAMNLFFQPTPGFDTFYFNNAPEAIVYREVQSPDPNTKGSLVKKGSASAPITITEAPNKEAVYKAVAGQIIELLSDPSYKITKEGREREITPSDIGILVRKKKEGRAIKSVLSHYCIPAVTIDDTKVLESDESRWLLYLLEAMLVISRQSINKALLSPFTGYRHQQILQLDDEVTLGLFRKYRLRWQDDGIFSALMDFVADFNVKEVLLHANTESGERIIANLFHLIELVHKVQTNKQFAPVELVSWLRRGIEGMETEGDEFEQRVESDEESVNIITIHKSKGLEYNIVFAPALDLVELKDPLFHSYRDPVSAEYISIEKDKLTATQEQWVLEQNEQERRRLVYVAITRAVYRCYLHRKTSTHFNNSTLSYFSNALSNADNRLIEFEEAPIHDEKYRYRQDRGYKPPDRETPAYFELQHNNWTKMSYTMLAQKGEIISMPPASSQQDKYDHFVFNQLVRGSKTGNLLHQVFEQVHFSDSNNWKFVIDEALKQHLPRQHDLYAPMLTEMLTQVFQVTINVNGQTFRLSEILNNQRIHEFEFDFPVPEYNPADLNDLTSEGIEVRVSWDKPLEGIMNGKLDLFFEFRGKYYILDWKSNYLGDKLPDYSPDALSHAMNQSNYHLQYLIYTLAAKKYLQSRLDKFDYEQHFGGVIYLFVRGVRNTGDTGIYVNRPTLQQLSSLEKIISNSLASIS